MICKLNDYSESQIEDESLAKFLNDLPQDVRAKYATYLDSQEQLKNALSLYFNSPNQYQSITPLIVFNELSYEIVTLLLNNNELPDEVGEEGSILAFIRAAGYTDQFMCSDCYGQLSCSSCAVEVLQGTLENPFPRDEEFDMLDIDESKPPTEKTRLGCQAKVGTTPLLLKIRAPEKIIISKV
ncbi:MAG: 2Fe-2S iron-sulfur cluster-binding protein [Candidatus Margulisiibacteriota bacterium]